MADASPEESPMDQPEVIKKKKSSKKTDSGDSTEKKEKKTKKKASMKAPSLPPPGGIPPPTHLPPPNIKPPSSLPPPNLPPPSELLQSSASDLPPPPPIPSKKKSSKKNGAGSSSSSLAPPRAAPPPPSQAPIIEEDTPNTDIESPSRAPPPPPSFSVEGLPPAAIAATVITESNHADDAIASPPRNVRNSTLPPEKSEEHPSVVHEEKSTFELEEEEEHELEIDDDEEGGKHTDEANLSASLYSRALNPKLRSFLHAKLEGQGLDYEPWREISPNDTTSPLIFKEQGGKNGIKGKDDELTNSCEIDLDWVVDIKQHGTEVNKLSEYVIATAWKYSHKLSSGSADDNQAISSGIVSGGSDRDQYETSISVSYPDRTEPEWEGEIKICSQDTDVWGSELKLIECCDQPGSLSSLLFSTHIRENICSISWQVEYSPLVLDEDGDGDDTRVGVAKWLSKSTNQLLIYAQGSEQPEVVDIDLLITLLSPISNPDGNSAESDALYWSLAKSGMVSLFWSDHEHEQQQQQQQQQQGSNSPSSSDQLGHRQTPSPQPEFSAIEDLKPLHTTPIELARDQLELLMHYETELRKAADQAHYDRDMAMRDQDNVMNHLHRFVFEGDLMQGHKVLELLSHRANDPSLRYKLNSNGILKHVAQIEEDLWHVLNTASLTQHDTNSGIGNGGSSGSGVLEVGSSVLVLCRGNLWEDASVVSVNEDVLSQDGQCTYDIQIDATREILSNVCRDYIDPKQEHIVVGAENSFMNKEGGRHVRSSLPLWLCEERKRVQSELSKRSVQRQALEMLMKELDNSRLKGGNKSKIDPSAFLDKSVKEPLHQIWDGSKPSPQLGDQVGVMFGNGKFVGNVVRIHSSGDNSGGDGSNAADVSNSMLFDVGFSGEHVEVNLPISRLLTLPTNYQLDTIDSHNHNDDAAAHMRAEGQQGQGQGHGQVTRGHLRLVCLSLNMSHQTLNGSSTNSSTNSGDTDGGGGGGGSLDASPSNPSFEMWVCQDGVFEAVAVDDLHEQADIVVISLQDVSTNAEELNRLRETISAQLGASFHLCGLVQRFQGQLQCMVFVRTLLIPTEGLLALCPKSSAITFGPDATVTSYIDQDKKVKESQGEEEEEAIPVGCVGGLLFAITVLGVKFCFVSVRLSHGLNAEDVRKKELSDIIDTARQLGLKQRKESENAVGEVSETSLSSVDSLDEFDHLIVLGDLGSRIRGSNASHGGVPPYFEKASESPEKKPLSHSVGGPLVWRSLYAADELHNHLKEGLFPGLITPDCHQFPPIQPYSLEQLVANKPIKEDELYEESSFTPSPWAVHYGPRCLVKSSPKCFDDIICREYIYLPSNPTKLESVRYCPQLPLRACFHVAF